MATADLPDDPASLKAIIAALSGALSEAETTIASLRLQLARARRQQFGAKSEKLDRLVDQLELQLEDLEAAEGARIADAPTAAAAILEDVAERRMPARRPLPEHLPRETITHPGPAACPCCGGKLAAIGEDVSEVLEYVPGRFKAIRHIRPKFSCRSCETIHQPPAPSLPIIRGRAGPKLLAHVLVSKFDDHLPLYRQAEIYARDGVDLERSTLGNL